MAGRQDASATDGSVGVHCVGIIVGGGAERKGGIAISVSIVIIGMSGAGVGIRGGFQSNRKLKIPLLNIINLSNRKYKCYRARTDPGEV